VFAYVFWHKRLRRYSAKEYEERLTAFHKTLSTIKISGFRGSFVAKIEGSTWMEGETYEDWYLVDGLAVLEELNSLVGRPELSLVHRRVARMAEGGKGAILAPVKAVAEASKAESAAWLSKPHSYSYSRFYAELEATLKDFGVQLWRRQLAVVNSLNTRRLIYTVE